METVPSSLPDTITITEYHFLDVKSKGADVECTVTVHFDRQPLPAVVAQIRNSLKGIGLDETALSVSNLRRDNELFGCTTTVVVLGLLGALYATGQNALDPFRGFTPLAMIGIIVIAFAWTFLRGTTCTFKIRCSADDAVGRVHKLLGDHYKKVTVLSTSWRYEVPSEELAAWSVKCIERANARAQVAAKALGVQIVGVFSYEEHHELPQRHYTPPVDGAPAMARRARKGGMETFEAESTSVVPSGESRAGASVRVQYRVANYTAPVAVS
jgi:hypothetical protein